MKKLIILAIGLATLAMPSISAACHVTGVDGNADCNGWSLCTTIFFISSVDEGCLEYRVTILDGGGDEVTRFGETLIVTHPPGEGTFEYCFAGVWDGDHFVTDGTVVITSALDGENPTVFTFDLGCTVDAVVDSFGDVKARYR